MVNLGLCLQPDMRKIVLTVNVAYYLLLSTTYFSANITCAQSATRVATMGQRWVVFFKEILEAPFKFMKMEGYQPLLFSLKTTLKAASCMYRYAAIGVSSFGNTKNTLENRVPDVYAKVTPDVKKWIQGIATNTQDSNCGIEA